MGLTQKELLFEIVLTKHKNENNKSNTEIEVPEQLRRAAFRNAGSCFSALSSACDPLSITVILVSSL